jgi:anti-anti-sigma factor
MTADARGQPLSTDGTPETAGKAPVLDQVFDADSLFALRAAVAAHAAQATLPEGRVGDLVLAVHELAANAVRHGAGHGRVRLWAMPDVVRCEVADDGAAPPAGAGAAPAEFRQATPWREEPGHGLWLVRQVADQASWHCGPSGTVCALSFRLPPDRRAPFRLTRSDGDGCVIVTVAGELDLGSAGQFAAAVSELIGEPPGLRLVLDLAGLTGWDSSGLAALITAQRQVRADPAAQMVLAGLPGHLSGRLRDSGMADRFTLAGTRAEAVRMLIQLG